MQNIFFIIHLCLILLLVFVLLIPFRCFFFPLLVMDRMFSHRSSTLFCSVVNFCHKSSLLLSLRIHIYMYICITDIFHIFHYSFSLSGKRVYSHDDEFANFGIQFILIPHDFFDQTSIFRIHAYKYNSYTFI